ncbi:M20 peptidase aminoacylase family protein [Psychrobacillus vulpis]|uniref:Amidohydrolase n=1 Tax=Psychrobacillus vulpis TaxID=2325572 RepID=A0A544TVG2_9BACI|nr:M20 peptidase aminoacylase family protein [Psychrobacillus vulpis]TQR21437.1 amidohydrolase [Psychrobacillus vulpis]
MVSILEVEKDIKEIFSYLHEHPETSWNEVHTTKYIKELLEKEGCRVTSFNDCTGLFAEIGAGSPVVAIRADMDALWQEVDGVFRANHSCGHDAHMTMVIGAIRLLLATKFNGKIRFIFQPAEEKGNGALKMVEKGAVDDVNYLFGIHLRPIQELPSGKASPTIVHGAGCFMHAVITGDDSHGARPHLTSNAVDVITSINHLIKFINVDPQVPSSIKITSVQAGGDNKNIIPGNGNFSIDMRAQNNETMAILKEKALKVFHDVERLYNTKIEYYFESELPAAIVNEDAQDIMGKAISHVLGRENCTQPLVTSGGDDFHFYTIKKPELKATMIGLGCDLEPGLHHPKMTFNHDMLMTGSEILKEAALIALSK